MNSFQVGSCIIALLLAVLVGALIGSLITGTAMTSAWERDAIRNRVATYDQETGRFMWVKPVTLEENDRD